MELLIIPSLKELISKNKIEDAIFISKKFCKDGPFFNDIILINARYKKISKDKIRGTISEEYYTLSINRIRESFLKFLDMIVQVNSKIEKIDSQRFIYYASNQQARFDYFNFQRVFELFLVHKTPFKDIPVYQELRKLNILNDLGTLNESNKWLTSTPSNFRIDVEVGYLINFYMKTILERTIPKLYLKDITNFIKSKQEINAKLYQGDFFYCQLGFHFKNVSKNTEKEGKGQLRKACFNNKKIKIEFIFDAWECTSNSGKFDSLRSRNIINPILYLKGMNETKDILSLNVSCLAIGYAFNNMKIDRKFSK